MAKYINAAEAAEKVATAYKIPMGDLVDIFAGIPAADAIEDLKQLADNIEKERRCLEEEVHRLSGAECQHSIELACKEVEIEILRGELRRMFRLYVAAETRADTGVNTDELC